MLKVLTAKQTKSLDAYTIANEPIASIDLMERACRSFVTWFAEKFDSTKRIGIVCGTGNNGGDGLGIARVLYDRNYLVKVWIVRGTVTESEDFKTNFNRLPSKIPAYEIRSESDRGLFGDCDILIDALFGTGLSRPLEGIYAQVISCINQSHATRIAIDLPSGLMADSRSTGAIVNAHYTVSFQLPKLAFFLPENGNAVGEWTTTNIGLSKEFIAEIESSHFLLERSDILKIKKTRSRFSHKGTYGKALLIAGSYGKMGAAVLASKAAMRSGLGLLTTHIPSCGYEILQTTVPEVMVSIDTGDKTFSLVPSVEGYDSIGVGPGIGMAAETCKAFASLLSTYSRPLVIDADGLNILAGNREFIHLIPVGSILTPHPKEFERLAGNSKDDFERLEKLKKFAVQTKSVIILKGAFTAIASPQGQVYFNPTGNPGMATGGSGDVLTGLLTGLLAQHYTPLEAAQLGVYLHGLAGDLAARVNGFESMIASDLIAFTSNAFIELR